MKKFAQIESHIVFIKEEDEQDFYELYHQNWSITKLETIYFDDGNILKMEKVKSKSLKGFDYLLSY